MSTNQQYLVYDNSTQANFQSWAQAISLQFDAAGWTKTSDTGQVNWSTNPAVPAVNTWTLYEIRQPASDPLQTGATAFYLRIDYGQKIANAPAIRIQLGQGTNGSGTLTGFTTAANVVCGGTAASTGNGILWECNFSYDASRFGALLWRNSSNSCNTVFFGIERIKATDGTDSTDGFNYIGVSGACSSFIMVQSTVTFTNGPFSWNNQLLALCPGSGSSLAYGGSIPICPVFPLYGKWGNPMTIAGFAAQADMVEGAIITTTLYGATRTYMMTKTINQVTNGSYNLLFRFD